MSALALLTLDARDSPMISGARAGMATIVRPLGGAVDTATAPLGTAWGGLTRSDDLRADNARLRARIPDLEAGLPAASQAIDGLAAALRSLGIVWVGDAVHLTVDRAAGASSNFSHDLVIDAGGTEGVGRGMAVEGGGGLFGVIVEVRATTSVVRPLTDPATRVAVRFSDGSLGWVRGAGPGRSLRVDRRVEDDPDVPAGPLMTSGADGPIPPGVPVGPSRPEGHPARLVVIVWDDR